MVSKNDIDIIEEWRPVKGYEGSYQVSNLGNVRSLPRLTNDGKRITGKLLAISSSDRYPSVSLYKCNVETNASVHRLVAEAFIPNPEGLPEVNHIDTDRTNNKVTNLEWVSTRDNIKHAVQSGRKTYRVQIKCLETQEVFPSMSAAGRFVNTDATRISESIATKSCCKGYTFIRADEAHDINEDEYLKQAHSKYQDFHKQPVMSTAKALKCVETGQVFQSIAEASRVYGCDTVTISKYATSGKPFRGITLQFI